MKVTERLPLYQVCCTMYRGAVGKHTQPLVEQLIRLYEAHNHSCYLYLGSILVDEFAGRARLYPRPLTNDAGLHCPDLCYPRQAGRAQRPSGHRRRLFRLNARSCNARLALPADRVSKVVVECGLLSTKLEHREANASVMKFFYDLQRAGVRREDQEDYEARNRLITSLNLEFGSRLVESLHLSSSCAPSALIHLH